MFTFWLCNRTDENRKKTDVVYEFLTTWIVQILSLKGICNELQYDNSNNYYLESGASDYFYEGYKGGKIKRIKSQWVMFPLENGHML